ncbi:MAG: hypothetical protein ABIK98_02350 [Pseudomonadota bacterium]
MPSLAVKIDGKKFMWDQGLYASEAEAKEKMARYEKEGFQVSCLNEEGKYLIYTRRVVAEIN